MGGPESGIGPPWKGSCSCFTPDVGGGICLRLGAAGPSTLSGAGYARGRRLGCGRSSTKPCSTNCPRRRTSTGSGPALTRCPCGPKGGDSRPGRADPSRWLGPLARREIVDSDRPLVALAYRFRVRRRSSTSCHLLAKPGIAGAHGGLFQRPPKDALDGISERQPGTNGSPELRQPSPGQQTATR